MSEPLEPVEDATKTAAPEAAPPKETVARPKGPKLVEAIVRRGTVVIGDHGDTVHVGPGGKVLLTEKEVLALRASGVLHDPESDPMVDVGPTVDNDLVEPKVRAPRAAPAKRKR